MLEKKYMRCLIHYGNQNALRGGKHTLMLAIELARLITMAKLKHLMRHAKFIKLWKNYIISYWKKKMIGLPKPDKRYKKGKIKKDNKGVYRGNPETVTPKFIDLPYELTPNDMALVSAANPPMIVSPELAKYIQRKMK